jgi:hypothetical protein
MSDYLWDKTGEPNAEVERLEGLLGTFRHSPRALELPSEAAPLESQRSRRFDASRLAVAAALLLAFVTGAEVFLRTRVATVKNSAASDEAHSSREARTSGEAHTSQPPREASSRERDSTRQEPANAPLESVTAKGLGQKRDEKIAVQVFAPEKQGGQVAVFTKRRQKLAQPAATNGTRVDDVSAVEALRAESRGGAHAALESTRLMAKEQLVYALRLTGAKLREVQRKTQGLDNSKPAFDARDKLR